MAKLNKKDLEMLHTLNPSVIDSILWERTVDAARDSLRAFVDVSWSILEPASILLPNWHIDAICEHLEAVTAGQIKRLIINIPPRYMKSLLVSVMWPAWEWIKNPSERFIFSSYSQSLSMKHSVDRRRLMQNDLYVENFSTFNFTTDQNVKTEYENDQRGHMIATSTGGTITGKGGNRIVIDDPHNPKESVSDVQRQAAIDHFKNTLKTRLDDKKNGAIIVVMQRLHEKDLTGYLLESEGSWEHLKIQGQAEKKIIYTMPISKKEIVVEKGQYLHPDREDEKEHKEQKADLGSYSYNAQYQQAPAPPEGNMFLRVWWNFYNVDPVFDIQVQSWDCAFKGKSTSDFVAGEVWGAKKNKFYLRTLLKDKLGFVKTKQAIRTFRDQYPKATRIWVEDAANGPAVIEELSEEITGLIPVTPEGGKEARANACTAIIESGCVYLPCLSDPTEWNRTPVENRTIEMQNSLVLPMWVQDFIESCSMFPNAAHDDDVDAMTQALIQLRKTVYASVKDIKVGRNRVAIPDSI